jgi:5'-phosphate synthase pdxT subunit
MSVGVLAVQGDFQKHLDALARVGEPCCEVRTPEDLTQVRRLIIPGGESTTVGLLLQRHGTGDAIINAAMAGMPVWGTCMGMILMARDVEGRSQYTLGLLDITVQRNAFGAQVHSFEDSIIIDSLQEPVTGVFIRAPIVSSHGPNVQVIGRYHDRVVAVRQGNLFGTSFHPELTEDDRFLRVFLAA